MLNNMIRPASAVTGRGKVRGCERRDRFGTHGGELEGKTRRQFLRYGGPKSGNFFPPPVNNMELIKSFKQNC